MYIYICNVYYTLQCVYIYTLTTIPNTLHVMQYMIDETYKPTSTTSCPSSSTKLTMENRERVETSVPVFGGLGFRVSSLGFRVASLGRRVSSLEFRMD